ncbi:MAG: TonB-dependent receptor [Halioglobus sp.]
MKSFTKFGTLAALLYLPAGSMAQQVIEEVIVTSSRISMPVRQVGTSISVVSAAEIQQRGFSSLYEVLRTQPGVAASNAGGPGKASTLRIRGEEGFRTLVLLDGIDISDASSPQVSPRMEQLLSSGIGRVEILRGPQGLMYGADAGGVINITSLDPERDGIGQLSAEAGEYGTSQYAGNIGADFGAFDVALSAARLDTDGFNSRSTDTILRDDDGFKNTTLHGRFGWNISENLRAQLVMRQVDSDNDYDSCFTTDTFSPTDKCTDEFKQDSYRLSGEYSHGHFMHELAYNFSDTDREFFSDGVSSFRPKGEIESASYLGSFRHSETLQLVYGIDLQNESLDDGSFDTDRDQDGYYFEYQGSFVDDLFVTAGVRYDDNEDFGSHTSYRVSGAYLIPLAGGETKLRGSYGTGFRAPSLYENAYNSGPFAYPPASETELKEEKSSGYDLGISWTSAHGLYLEAVYFDQTVSDEIFFDLIGFSGYLQGNGDADSTGVELILEWPVADSISLAANYTYNDTETESNASRAFRPTYLANLGVNWQPLNSRLIFGINARVSRDSQGVAGESLDDYEVLDLNASFEVLTGLEVFGRIENLTDTDYEEIPTYNTSGRAGYAGVRYNF